MNEILHSHFDGAVIFDISGVSVEYQPLRKSIDSAGAIEQGPVYFGEEKKYIGEITKMSSVVLFTHYPDEAEYTDKDVMSAISQALI